MAASRNLYQQVLRISHVYLGTAANRFVDRQIINHLKKRPEALQVRDLPELIAWIKLAMSFLFEDQAVVRTYVSRLRALYNRLLRGHAPQA